MNMSNSITGMDVIVLIAVLFTVVFVGAWLASANLRAWIERPKYWFLANVEDYDRARKQDSE
jgi:NADH:ubiquinone oxidoreductase subunit H